MNERAQLENHVDTRTQQRIHENRPAVRNGTVVRDNVPKRKGECEALTLAKSLKKNEDEGKKEPSPLLARLGRHD